MGKRAHLIFKTHYWTQKNLKNTVVLISHSDSHRVSHIDTVSIMYYLYKKLNYIKTLRQLDKKWLKMVIYMLHSVKKHFSKSKSHSLTGARDQETFLA